MARSRIVRPTDARAPLRLRVPASIVVAVVGVSTTIATSFGGCQETPIPDPIDSGLLERVRDAGPDGAATDGDVDGDRGDVDGEPDPDAGMVPSDASIPPDAPET